MDFCNFKKGVNNNISIILLMDKYLGIIWDYYLKNYIINLIIIIFLYFIKLLKK